MTRREPADRPADDGRYGEQPPRSVPEREPIDPRDLPPAPPPDRVPAPPAQGISPELEPAPPPTGGPPPTDLPGLLPQETESDYLRRWETVQAGFVDEPRTAVAEADRLVAEVMSRLSDLFDRQRRSLETQWSQGDASTEDLRLALQRYRDFFRRLVQT